MAAIAAAAAQRWQTQQQQEHQVQLHRRRPQQQHGDRTARGGSAPQSDQQQQQQTQRRDLSARDLLQVLWACGRMGVADPDGQLVAAAQVRALRGVHGPLPVAPDLQRQGLTLHFPGRAVLGPLPWLHPLTQAHAPALHLRGSPSLLYNQPTTPPRDIARACSSHSNRCA